MRRLLLLTTLCFSLLTSLWGQLSVTTSPDVVICVGEQTLLETVSVTGGDGNYTYAWSPTTSLLTPTAASTVATPSVTTTYTLTVSDGQGETGEASVTVTVSPSPVIPDPVITHLTCQGENNGAIGFVENPAWIFQWSTGDTEPFISNLSAGNYCVTVTDLNGCSTQACWEVLQPTELLVDLLASVVMDADCNGSATGSISAVVTGGTPPYSYLWTPNAATTATVSGLLAGEYCLDVTDSNGCITQGCYTVTEPDNLVINATVSSQPSCENPLGGVVTIEVMGGTPTYIYSLNSVIPQVSNTFSGLTAGNYAASVIDMNGCVESILVTLAGGGPTTTITGETAICVGEGTTLQAIATGGVAPYTYLWSTNTTTPTIDIVPAITTNYSVTVTDNEGCSTVGLVIVDVSDPTDGIESIIEAASCGDPNGVITLLAPPGADLEYSIQGNTDYQFAGIFQGVPGGEYDVWVRNADGSCARPLGILTVPEVSGFTLDLTEDFTICPGETATLEAIVTGNASGTLQYLWPGGQTTLPTTTVTPSQTTTYDITVTDDNCAQTAQVTVYVFDDNPPILGPTTACLDALFSLGTDPQPGVNYTWSAPGGFPAMVNGTTAVFTFNEPGNYLITLTADNGNCSEMTSHTVTVLDNPTVDAGPDITVCLGQETQLGSDGNPPGIYEWRLEGGLSFETVARPIVSPTIPTTYTLVFTNLEGCQATDQVTVTPDANLNPIADAGTDVFTCNEAAVLLGGDPTATPAPGNPGDAIQDILWFQGDVQNIIATVPNAAVEVGTQPTTYGLLVVANSGCADTASVTVSPSLLLDAVITPVNCSITDTEEGSIDLSVTGGEGPYDYLWTGPEGFTSETEDITGLPVGQYSVTVTSTDGCTATGTYEMVAVNPFDIEFVAIELSCGGIDDGAIIITSSVSSDWTFQWSNGSTAPTIQGLSAGTYCVTITSTDTACEGVECITIAEPPVLDVVVDGIPTEACDTDYTLTPTITGGIAPYQFEWRTNGVLIANSSVLMGGPGVVDIVLTITDAGGCVVEEFINIDVEPRAEITSTGVLSCATGEVLLDGSTSSSGPNYSYEWTGPDGNVIGDQPTLVVAAAGQYTLEVIDNTTSDCSATETVTVIDPLTEFNLDIVTEVTGCNSYRLSGQIPPDYFGQILFTWTLPDGTTSNAISVIPTQSGIYQLETQLVDFQCVFYATVLIDLAADECATLEGSVRFDESEDCNADEEEVGIEGVVVTATGTAGVFNAVTDPLGNYSLNVPVGEYVLATTLPSPSWMRCQDEYPVSVAAGQTMTVDIPLQRQVACPELAVDLSAGLIRRCFTGTYFLQVRNIGTEAATAPEVILDLDEFMTFQQASLTPIEVDGQQIRWTLSTLAPGESVLIVVTVGVSCDAELGQVHCSEAAATPDPLCTESDGWSGGNLTLSGECEGGEVQFLVTNTGNATTDAVQFVVIEDAVAMMQPVTLEPLLPGASQTFDFPANGSTYTFQIDQVANHPYSDNLSVSIEGCGLNEMDAFSTGFTTHFPQTTATVTSDIHCEENIGAYDPNDKAALPVGYGAAHYILPETELQYRIRFQNTGTDTAFTVIIRDTLSEHLDIQTLKPGVSSHDYELSISDERILTFTYNNILLPDSTTNLEGSQGFVNFRISPIVDTPLETVIENDAAIYFDFNEPVITNTIFHTLGRDFYDLINVVTSLGPNTPFKVFPNPTNGHIVVHMLSKIPEKAIARLYNTNQQLLLEEVLVNFNTSLSLDKLPTGIYLLQLLDDHGQLLDMMRIMKE